MNIKLEHFQVLLVVADLGSITAAAARIGRTPAAVSMTLSGIEREIGGALFAGERKSRLSPLGQHAVDQGRRIVAEHRYAIDAIRRFAAGEQGLSRIAVVPSVATRLLAGAIAELRRDASGIQVDIRDTDSAAIHQAIRDGSVDFGIASPADGDDLQAEFLLADPFHLVCRDDHPLAALRRPIAWRDVDEQNFIANGLCHDIDHPRLRRLIERSTLFMHNTLSILAFVEAGIGITVLPALTLSAGSGLRALPLADTRARRELQILYRRDAGLSPLNLRLINLVREAVATG